MISPTEWYRQIFVFFRGFSVSTERKDSRADFRAITDGWQEFVTAMKQDMEDIKEEFHLLKNEHRQLRKEHEECEKQRRALEHRVSMLDGGQK